MNIFRRVFGSWGDFKRGTAMGSQIRQKPVRWLERRGGQLGMVQAEERIAKFKKRYLMVAPVLFVGALCVFWLVPMPLLLSIIGSVLITLTVVSMYFTITRAVRRGAMPREQRRLLKKRNKRRKN